MKFRLTTRVRPACFAALCLGLIFLTSAVPAVDTLKFEAMLIWATNADTSPNPSHKPVPPAIRKKLEELPLKWKNYFLVNRVNVSVPRKGSGDASLSDECKIEVKHIAKDDIEVSLVGKGKPVLKRIQELPDGKMLVLGGNAPEETGWLVVLKRTE